MSSRGNSFFAFLLGIMAGGLLGVLFAPDKGTSTRDKITYRLDKYKKILEDLINDMAEGAYSAENEAKSEGEKLVKDAKLKAEKILDDVNGLIDQIKSD